MDHDPSLCAANCYYQFQLVNPQENEPPVQVSYLTQFSDFTFQSVNVNAEELDSLDMGKSRTYRIRASVNYFDKMAALTVTTQSLMGDVDITVSVDGESFVSASQLDYDQVRLTLGEKGVKFETDVYIRVYACVKSYYRLKIEPLFTPTIDVRLIEAKPLIDKRRLSLDLKDTQEALVSFRPWWTDAEARTVCFLIDDTSESLYFYAAVDVYPISYQEALIDQGGIIVIPHDSPFYTVARGAFGTYYIRVRQQYDFSSLVTDSTNSFDFYAFYQPPEGVITDLYANSTVMGVANSS